MWIDRDDAKAGRKEDCPFIRLLSGASRKLARHVSAHCLAIIHLRRPGASSILISGMSDSCGRRRRRGNEREKKRRKKVRRRPLCCSSVPLRFPPVPTSRCSVFASVSFFLLLQRSLLLLSFLFASLSLLSRCPHPCREAQTLYTPRSLVLSVLGRTQKHPPRERERDREAALDCLPCSSSWW